MTFAEVLLPLPLASAFTYSVPDKMAGLLKPGHRVIVPFGKKKFYTGIVTAVTPVHPQGFEPRPIEQMLDDAPIVRHPQLRFWEWIADYYLCSAGEVYKAALPAGLKIESETFIEAVEEWAETDPAALAALGETEQMVLSTLAHADKHMTLADLDKAAPVSGVPQAVARLIDAGAVRVSEKLVERYRSRRVHYVTPTVKRNDSQALHAAFEAVRGAPRQEKALMTLLDMSGFTRKGQPLHDVTRQALCDKAEVPVAAVAALVQKGLAAVEQRRVSRFAQIDASGAPLPNLTGAQTAALQKIHSSWLDKDITLLHGVTGSGKTEVYMHLVDYVLKQGNQVLLLVPEIALTTQLTRRMQRVFGARVTVYHSKHSDNERVDIWRDMLGDNGPRVVIGARSSVFLPFARLGLIIVDEEHESSFKQHDPTPRYNARDAALVLASMHGAKALLGSATPAVDTYYKAQTGRYALVELLERYGDVDLPRVEIIDMGKAREQRTVSGTYTFRLRQLAKDALNGGKQAIFFLNRRGYAPMAVCQQCAFVPKCEHCDVSLTYHKRLDRLVCHYCGTQYDVPSVCPACGEPAVQVVGYGTERIEDDIELFFPDEKILRMDLDTTRARDAYDRIIDDFSQGKSRILVGTQMVTKGLDFDNVGVVGVINADAMVNQPDFRATERAFNMLEQVAGRAGRKDGKGVVAVQTRRPEHPIFGFLDRHDYKAFHTHELQERRQFNYPPFTRLIYVYIRHADQERCHRLAHAYASSLRQLFGNRVHGPDAPGVARVQNLHIRRIMLKVEVEASMIKVKQILRQLYIDMANAKMLTGALVHYDVDPS